MSSYPTLHINGSSQHIDDILYNRLNTALSHMWTSPPIVSLQILTQLAREYHDKYWSESISFTECVLDIITTKEGYDISLDTQERLQYATNTYIYIARYCHIVFMCIQSDPLSFPLFAYTAQRCTHPNVHNIMMYEFPVPELWELYIISCKTLGYPVKYCQQPYFILEADPILYNYRMYFLETTNNTLHT